MKISLLDVQQVFNDLLNHKISREITNFDNICLE